MGKSSRKQSVVGARRGPSTVVVIGVVVVVLFAALVGFAVYRANRPDTAQLVVPPGATAVGVSVGRPDAPATIDLYLDFQCPICRAYEQQSGATLDQMIADGQARVVYHPVAYLDRFSSTEYSTRASEASGCAQAAGVFPRFAQLLYANQPPENSAGLPEQQLVALGERAGAGADFASCVASKRYATWTSSVTDAASKAGINGTPTVLVDGHQIDNSDEALRQAVAAAQH